MFKLDDYFTHHRHSGRFLAHHHTSYPALGFLLVLAGVVLSSASTLVSADPPPISSAVGVTAAVATNAPTISSLSAQTSAPTYVVRGSCESSLGVVVDNNGVTAGSVTCSTDDTFAITATLVPGNNILRAQHYRPGPISPQSAAITVVYTPVTPSVPGTSKITPQVAAGSAPVTPITIVPDHAYDSASLGRQIEWRVELHGGQLPYRLSWDWGDGTVETVDVYEAGPYLTRHTYQTSGRYQIFVKVIDHAARESRLQLGVLIQSAVETPGMGTVDPGNPESPGTHQGVVPEVVIAWPVFAAVVTLVVSFWLGAQHEAAILRGVGQLARR